MANSTTSSNSDTDTTATALTPPGYKPSPNAVKDAIDNEAQWVHTRSAVEAMGRALQPLSPTMRARVICASAILAGVDVEVVEMLSR